MIIQPNKLKSLVWIGCCAVLLMGFSVLLLSGCDTLDGDVTANQPPIVYFVNIPPDGFSFSRNPEVYWWGTDKDGLIDYYRYFVARVDETGADPLSFARNLNDTMWTYVDVDSTASDPQTANIIPLSANLDDPVRSYIEQYIFLQAFDNQGASSAIAYRRLFRNDNPPDTKIYNVDTPFVNAVFPGGLVTGMKFIWEGSDVKDYEELGLTAPPFEYRWKLFGPYTNAELNTGLLSAFQKRVYVTEDARVMYVGDTLLLCDTALMDTNIGGVDTTIAVERCDTTIFTGTETDGTAFYRLDWLLEVESDSFLTSNYNRLVEESDNGIDGWVTDTRTTIYNAFKNFDADTTIQMNFIFWAQSRDDAGVVDLAPAFRVASCIDPKFERDVVVINFTSIKPLSPTRIKQNTPQVLWGDLLRKWKPEIVFDTVRIATNLARDFIFGPVANTQRILLSHKLMILYNDAVWSSGLVPDNTTNITPVYAPIFTALDVGVNAWMTMRAPVVGGIEKPYDDENPVPRQFTNYFGVDNVIFSGWASELNFRFLPPIGRHIEDFIGTYSLDESRWPALAIDTALLHSRYQWQSTTNPLSSYWIDTIACFPEVDWYWRSYGTVPMYLYKSRFGATNPFGYEYNFEGTPVAHLMETNLYRTFYCAFTPFAMDSVQMQQLADTMLTWLYDAQKWEDAGAVDAKLSTIDRYPNAAVRFSPEQILERREELLQSVRDQLISSSVDE